MEVTSGNGERSAAANARRVGIIVVGVDGSEGSKEALRWAARQAEMSGAELRVILAWHLPASVWPAGALVPLDFSEGGQQTLDESITEVLGDHPQITVSSEVVESLPAPALIAAAADADLLVVGSRGHGAFAGMLLGSVSQHCVTHAGCPVVVVRPNHAPEAVAPEAETVDVGAPK